ncbi:hypothetical protein COCCADRAFT_27698 [Bipolaris zeicola 26-R-13]|uniref:Uncharacterized protein n=1 Tax=Cochliobolus carbonum (strain 26-R-13) TaxID=930089 RepID=W6Y889_COCC2|nr:uncharacterized protein COCCADRAFT_27698 [Bipolaris zeicola 26-R-13]EUC31584.1 hypothetical protein COCCADRAFT_27698 [Bipolaris zeicola 26-R-13]
MELSQAVTDNLEGDILSFLRLTTEVDDKACLAFIMEASLRALAQGQNLLNTIFAAFLTAQCIESGQLTKRDILDNYCTCPDTFTRANTDHYYDGNLLQVHQPYDVLKLIGNRVEAQHRYEVKAGAKPAWDIAEMSKMLSTRYSPLPNEWIDGYSGTTMSLKATIYHPESNMYRSKSSHHPYILSVEKPHNMCLDAKGKIALHYYDNDILTKDCINRVKGLKTNHPAEAIIRLLRAIRMFLNGFLFSFRSYPIPDTDSPWTDNEWNIILDDIRQIENDRGSGSMNQHKLMLPRMGKDGIPWPWPEITCPKDVDRFLVYQEFHGRLRTMTEMCNKHHTTDDSPATLFLEYIVQWFETGGKCHFFGFSMTAFRGHPTNFSFGRGLVQHMKDATSRNIQAGEPMQTGFMSLLPKNMATECDVSRRTVIFESWRANILRHHYPSSPAFTKILEDAFLDLQDENDWYGPMGKLDDYAYVPMPMSYRRRTRWFDAFKSGEDEVEDWSDEDFDDGVGSNGYEEDDEEINVLAEHEAEVQAVQNSGDLEEEPEGQQPRETILETRDEINSQYSED